MATGETITKKAPNNKRTSMATPKAHTAKEKSESQAPKKPRTRGKATKITEADNDEDEDEHHGCADEAVEYVSSLKHVMR